MNDLPQISVIIPVYNSEKYLKQCISSILDQTFNDFELIIINDGSADGSALLCDEYALVDKRIKVFHKENGGVSSARNLGLENAKGEYITFVDSDDLVSVDYLKNIMVDNYDFTITGIKMFSRANISRKPIRYSIESNEHINDFIYYIDSIGFIFNGPCQKRYKLSLIRHYNLSFDKECDYGEDTLFVIKYLFICNSAIAIEAIDYYYRIENIQSLSSDTSFYKRLKYINLLLTLFEEWSKENSKIINIVDNQLISALLLLYNNKISRIDRISVIKEASKNFKIKFSWYKLGISIRNFPFFILLEVNYYVGDMLCGLFSKLKNLKSKYN